MTQQQLRVSSWYAGTFCQKLPRTSLPVPGRRQGQSIGKTSHPNVGLTLLLTSLHLIPCGCDAQHCTSACLQPGGHLHNIVIKRSHRGCRLPAAGKGRPYPSPQLPQTVAKTRVRPPTCAQLPSPAECSSAGLIDGCTSRIPRHAQSFSSKDLLFSLPASRQWLHHIATGPPAAAMMFSSFFCFGSHHCTTTGNADIAIRTNEASNSCAIHIGQGSSRRVNNPHNRHG